MSDYLKTIESYIERPITEYALLINGEWGNGKTYFLQNIVFPHLKQKGKIPIYISLNGIKTVEELSKKLYLATSFLSNENAAKILNSKQAKITKEFTKLIFSAAPLFGFGSNTDANINYDNLIMLSENIILCFDDLERCNIEITEIMGYINNFVEHDGMKTIIVGNENEIKDVNVDKNKELKVIASSMVLGNNNDEKKASIQAEISELFGQQKKYEVIKEKLIGKTIFYVPNFDEIIDSMLQQYKEKAIYYFKFLKYSQTTIIKIFNTSKQKNLRTIKHSFDDFEKVFEVIHSNFESEIKFNEIALSYFIPFVIANIEYKEGNMVEDELLEYPSIVIDQLYFVYNKDKRNRLYEKYWNALEPKRSFNVSQAINIYICRNLLNDKEVVEEIESVKYIWEENKEETKEISSFEKIKDYFHLENHEFEVCVLDILRRVEDGDYNIQAYPKILNWMNYFHSINLIELDFREVYRKFEKGIKSESTIANLENYTERQLISLLNDMKNNQKNISEDEKNINTLVEKTIEEKYNEIMIKKAEDLLSLIPDKQDEFFERYKKLSDDLIPFFKYFDIEVFYEKIKELRNADLQHLYLWIQSVYGFSNIYDYYSSDLVNLKKLIHLFESDVQKHTSIRKTQYMNFIESLSNICQRLTKDF